MRESATGELHEKRNKLPMKNKELIHRLRKLSVMLSYNALSARIELEKKKIPAQGRGEDDDSRRGNRQKAQRSHTYASQTVADQVWSVRKRSGTAGRGRAVTHQDAEWVHSHGLSYQEIFQRAVIFWDEDAWILLQKQWDERMHLWFRQHPNCQEALRYRSEQEYIDDAFRRFWQGLSAQKLTFITPMRALRYIHLYLSCAIMETLRDHSPLRIESPAPIREVEKEVVLLEDRSLSQDPWKGLESILPGEKEKRVAYLHFHSHLSSSEIMRTFPGEFSSEAEVSQLKRRVMECIIRNGEELPH